MLQTLAGGVLGQVVAGNVGGFVVGSFITDVVKTAKIQYEDRQLENGEEAARRLKYNIKQAEEQNPDEKKKAEDQKDKLKKAEELQEKEKKAEEKKGEEKKDIERKVEEKVRELEKKAEEQKKKDQQAEELKEKQEKAEGIIEHQKKAEEQKKREKKAEASNDVAKRAALFINNATITPGITETGSKLEASVSYTLLGPESLKSSTITETRILTNKRQRYELDKRERSREQGTYSSTVKFTVSEEMPTGYCILYTMISDGDYTKTVKSEVIINR
jgi:flagellar biosynthesis GTPase FlhF